MEKLRILIVGHGTGLGGADRYMFDQAELLSEHGCCVNCIAFENGPLEVLYRRHNIPLTVCAISKLNALEISRLVKAYDFIIANTMYTIFFAAEAQKHKPTMLLLHDCFTFVKNIIDRTSAAEEDLHMIRHLYCVSKYQAGTLSKLGLNNMRILNNFVTDIYSPTRYENQNMKIKFLTVAHWNPVKGFDLALEAFECLTSGEKERVEWHIVGQMEAGKECRRFCDKARAKHWIIFHGAIADKKCLYRLYQECDVYLHMSREDSSPLAVADAAMMQLPLIVSKDTGASYLAENNAGWIVDEFDCRSSAAAIRESLNKKKLVDMGKAARTNYLTAATPTVYIHTLMKEIANILRIEKNQKICENTEMQACSVPSIVPKLRIALYGYNMYAQIEQFYNKKNAIYSLVGIYDKAYEHYQKQGMDIKNPEDLQNEEFHFVCICCIFDSTLHTITEFLSNIGIPREKICIGVKDIFKKISINKTIPTINPGYSKNVKMDNQAV